LAAPYIEAVAHTGMVMGFHIATDDYERTHPYRLGHIAARFPESRILMIHMGGVAFHDLSDAAIEVMAEHPNILGIGSAIRHVNVLKAIHALGPKRVAFGSDTPFNLMHVEVAAYRALLEDELDQDDIEAVMGGNIAKLLGIL
jgi:predicted TIM-barrel fold metal-dependent hydrolase